MRIAGFLLLLLINCRLSACPLSNLSNVTIPKLFYSTADNKTIRQSQPKQNKFRLLDAKDALAGDWEWIKNDTSAPLAVFPEQPWSYLHFGTGTEQSFGATFFDADKGYTSVSHFLAFTDGSHISTTLSDSFIPDDKGKKFVFEYQCYGYSLTIIYNGERFLYRRKTT